MKVYKRGRLCATPEVGDKASPDAHLRTECTHETTHPRHPGDIGDIGDISRKSLKLQDFLRAPSGDILGISPGDGDIPGDIFWNEDFHAQDTLARARCTGRFDAPKSGPLRRILWEERPETRGNDQLAHLRARHHMRVHRTGRFDAGNPYHEKWALRRCSDALSPVPVVPANANRFRFGNGSAFPSRRHGDH